MFPHSKCKQLRSCKESTMHIPVGQIFRKCERLCWIVSRVRTPPGVSSLTVTIFSTLFKTYNPPGHRCRSLTTELTDAEKLAVHLLATLNRVFSYKEPLALRLLVFQEFELEIKDLVIWLKLYFNKDYYYYQTRKYDMKQSG